MTTLLFLIAACGGSDLGEPECVDHGECATGEVCVDEICRVVECVSSDSCSLGSFCSPETHECVEGCEVEADCLPGDICDSSAQACVTPTSCVDTELDCPIGSRCQDGECNPVPGLCSECDRPSDCNANADCIGFIGDPSPYCWGTCSDQADCPHGFDCVNVGAGYGEVCVGECTWFLEQGLVTP